MVTLEQIRKQYEDLAKANTTASKSKRFTINDGEYGGTYPVRAYRTGALKSSIRVLLTSKEAGKVVFDLASVRYGVFLNRGFHPWWNRKKTIRRPFAAAAANDKKVKQLIDEYQKSVVEEVVLEQLQIVTEKLGKYGLGPKISPASKTKRYKYP